MLIAGSKVGRWTVLDRPVGDKKWPCICECGTKKSVNASNLRMALTLSCGCLHKERARASAIRHGLSHTGIHRSWSGMKNRCLNPKNTDFHHYGGRGIQVCERWLSFDNFLADMGASWSGGLTIERKNVNGDYDPSNCVWLPAKEQQKNKRTTVRALLFGRHMTIPEIAHLARVSRGCIEQRIRNGWVGIDLLEPAQVH